MRRGVSRTARTRTGAQNYGTPEVKQFTQRFRMRSNELTNAALGTDTLGTMDLAANVATSSAAASAKVVFAPTQFVAQGFAANQRVGNMVTIKRVAGKFKVTSTAASMGVVAVYLIVDTQWSNSNLLDNRLLWHGQSGEERSDAIYQMPNVLNSSRFRILKSWLIPPKAPGKFYNGAVNPAATELTAYSVVNFDVRGNIDVKYNASTGAATDVSSNQVMLVFGGDSATASIADITGTVTLLYTDQ